MSFLPVKQENEEAPTGITSNAPGTEVPPQTGGSVGEEASGPQAKGSATASPTQFGSSASKLGDYLSANAPQISQQADTLAGNLNTQYGNVNQGITNAANQFQQQVQGGYATPNQQLVNQAITDPTQFATDPNNVKAFQAQYNNQYTGPQNFEGTGGYADIQNQVGQAVQQGNLLGTQAGLQSYLQGQGSNPTQAMSTLDALLYRGNPEAQQKIQTAAGQFGNLTGQLGTATTGADQSVQDAQKAAQMAQDYARQGISGIANPLNEQMAKQFNENQSAYANRTTDVSKLYQLMNTPTGVSLTPEQTSSLGLQPGQFEQIQDINYAGAGINFPNFTPVNPGQFYKQNTVQATPPSLGTSATPQQIATMQALAQLTGGGYQQPFDPSQTGTPFQLPQTGTFDYEAAKNAGLQNLKSAYDINYANPAAINDPQLMSKLQSVNTYLNSIPDYSHYAPHPLPPGAQLAPGGSGGGFRGI